MISFVRAELEDYLILNGLRRIPPSWTGCPYAIYLGINVVLCITAERITVQKTTAPIGWHTAHEITGWSGLSTFNIMLLLHATGAVPFREFVTRVKKASGMRHSDIVKIFRRHMDEIIATSF